MRGVVGDTGGFYFLGWGGGGSWGLCLVWFGMVCGLRLGLGGDWVEVLGRELGVLGDG